MNRLEGKTAIVTGAAQGLGYAVALRFAAEGARILMADRQEEKLHLAAQKIDSIHGTVMSIGCDVSDSDQVAQMVAVGIDAFGQIDIMVNCAGGSGSVATRDIEEVTDDIWDQVIDSNLKGTFLCCRAVAPHMKQQKNGRIINFSSGIAKGASSAAYTAAATLPYAAAKQGIIGLSKQLATDLARWNILVNVILPGLIITEEGARVRDRFDKLTAEQQRAMLERRPLKRAGEPQEIAATALFLASDESSYVSGTVIEVTGAA